MRAVLPPIIPIISDLTRQAPGTVSLAQGVVGYGPPPEALAVLGSISAAPQEHQYPPDEGLPELIEALAAKLERENHIRLATDSCIVVTAGSNMAFSHAVCAIADPGDEIVLQAPYYFNHHMAVMIAGCQPICVPTDQDYQLRLDAIERAITPRTRAIVTISPNNPTGAVYPEDTLTAVNQLCARYGIYHIHDEAYEYFLYGGARHFSPASRPEVAPHTISLFTFSKSYAMAAWRVGYMVIPAHLQEAVYKIQDTVIIAATKASQQVALAAVQVGAGYCRERARQLGGVRNAVLARLAEISDICTVPVPDGAFYCFIRVHADIDPLTLAERLIREHRVAVLPGSVFGSDACSLRISYGALDAASVDEGMRRLVGGLRAIVGGSR
jgi:aspartate/methionine/tyrosine aminotransferase